MGHAVHRAVHAQQGGGKGVGVCRPQVVDHADEVDLVNDPTLSAYLLEARTRRSGDDGRKQLTQQQRQRQKGGGRQHTDHGLFTCGRVWMEGRIFGRCFGLYRREMGRLKGEPDVQTVTSKIKPSINQSATVEMCFDASVQSMSISIRGFGPPHTRWLDQEEKRKIGGRRKIAACFASGGRVSLRPPSRAWASRC